MKGDTDQIPSAATVPSLAHDMVNAVERNARLIRDRAGKELDRLMYEVLPKLLSSQAHKGRKVIRLKEIADTAMQLISPNTPCKKGCSYCCHIAMPISRTEAEGLSAFTGRKMATTKRPTMMEAPDSYILACELAAQKFMNKPCPFLGHEGVCTVYEIRPVPCRTHHVVEESPERCDTFSGKTPTSKVNLTPMDMAATAVMFDEQWADIREWFPDGL